MTDQKQGFNHNKMTKGKHNKRSYFSIFLFPLYRYSLYTLISLISLFPFQTHAQTQDSINYLDESNWIFKPNIKSVLFHREGWDMSMPVIKLNTDEKLKLSFDDMDADQKDFAFTIVHCNAGWQPSDLDPNEYIDGYEEDDILNYGFSLNTLVPYTHYDLIFPTENMIPKLSGNYIMKVYVDDPDSIYFTRRFFVEESKVTVSGRVKQASMIEDRNYKQEVDFTINTKGYNIPSPYQDIKVIILQNGRWDNRIDDLKPKVIISDKLDYDYDRENVFQGGNEFKTVDIKSLKYNTENIASIKSDRENYYVYLKEEERRSFRVYKTEKDINGQMIIKTEDGFTSETEAEYVNVYFSMPYAAPMIDGDFYIIGQLTDWCYSGESKMTYNFTRKAYEKTLLLKQGFYNYQVVLKYHDQESGDESFIEGTHSETENGYTILLYHRDLSYDYDRLIGIKFLNSGQEK